MQKFCRKKSTNRWLGKKNDEQYILNKPKVVSHSEKLKKRKEKKEEDKVANQNEIVDE